MRLAVLLLANNHLGTLSSKNLLKIHKIEEINLV